MTEPKKTVPEFDREFTIPMKLKAAKKNSVRFAAEKGAVTDIYLLNFAAKDAKEIEVVIRVRSGSI